MYESPIEIFKTEIEYKIENEIMSMVQKQGVTIDKDELLRALNYDRNQYDKGYADGKIAAIDELVRCKDCKHRKTIDCSLWYGSLGATDYFIPTSADFYCSCGERAEENA